MMKCGKKSVKSYVDKAKKRGGAMINNLIKN